MVGKIDPAPTADTSRETETQRKRLFESCREFESVLTGQMLKSMRESVSRAEEPDTARGIYEEMMDSQLVKELSNKGDMGIAATLFERLESLIKPGKHPGTEDTGGKGGETPDAPQATEQTYR